MKLALTIFVLMPWWVSPLVSWMIQVPYKEALTLTSFMWMVLSPVIMGFIILIAFTEVARAKRASRPDPANAPLLRRVK